MNEILKCIYIKGKLHHDAMDIKFYHKHNILNIYDEIFNLTDFLNEFDVSLRERIYYLENNFTSIQICPHCKVNKLKFRGNEIRLTNSCGSKECKNSQLAMTRLKNPRPKKHSISICKGCKCEFLHIPCESKKYCSQECYFTNRIKYNHSEETKKKISETNKQVHNTPEFKLRKLEMYTDKYRQNHSRIMKEKIASGEFTPCITNTWTHWDAKVELEDGTVKKFRSSWEACFWFCNQHLEYEKVRIPYSIDGTWKNYIVDFVDTEQKILYEIKPNSVKDNESNVLKSEAAKEWCKVNNYSYSMITDEWFIENVKNVDFKNNTGILEKMGQFLVK